jgi:hypothetical protein
MYEDRKITMVRKITTASTATDEDVSVQAYCRVHTGRLHVRA